MSNVCALVLFFSLINVVLLQGTGSGSNGNLRLCIVEGRGSYKRAPKYCPILDEEESGVECVLGSDRLDCLRRISKGTVDFGVFSPEDLIAAQWADIDVLVTNELRLRDRPFERNVVAIINRRILPDSSSNLHAVLKNRTLCHPGVGLEDIRPLSETLSGYLESLVLEKSCDPKLSLTENRIKALADFFGKACKAGPWIPDKTRDAALKHQYPALCAACRSPTRCDSSDGYWGDSGALLCLGEGAGDVTWAEMDDVIAYFGLTPSSSQSRYPSTERFAFLCRDGTWQPLKGNPEPCVWLHRPWPVIVAKRKASESVVKLTSILTNNTITVDQHWPGALIALLESNQALPQPLSPSQAPMDYLATAKGFREAYSQTGCDPPRHITMCTTSLLAKNKCEWLSEAGAVYGIAPPLQCVVRENTQACMQAVKTGESDVTVADSDWLVKGMRDYALAPVLHEITPIVEKTNTVVAYVSSESKISKLADLRGKRAAFPRFDGVSWHSVLRYTTEKEKISCKEFVNGYFKEICAPGVENETENLKNCYDDGEIEALKSLTEGKSDVAFISMDAFNMIAGNKTQYTTIDLTKIVPICPEDNNKYCFIGWSNIGHVFAAKNLTEVRRHEVINVLTKLDQMFGKHPPFHSPMFSMYGPFNHDNDVIFHNNTRSLASDYMLSMHPYDKIPMNFELKIMNVTDFTCGFGYKIAPSVLVLFLTLVCSIIISV